MRARAQFTKAFKWIDRDRTGSITREELVQALRELNILDGLLQEEVVENVIDFMDAQVYLALSSPLPIYRVPRDLSPHVDFNA